MDVRATYVAVSRACTSAVLYTDNRAYLTEVLGLRDGSQVGAIDEALAAKRVAIAIPTLVRAAGMAIGG